MRIRKIAAALLALLLIALPAVFYPFLCLHPAVLWGSVIALLVTGLFATAMLASALDAEWISKKEYLAGVQAAQELEHLEKDEKYAQMEKEYYQQCKEDKAFAQMWQAEWLAACKKHN